MADISPREPPWIPMAISVMEGMSLRTESSMTPFIIRPVLTAARGVAFLTASASAMTPLGTAQVVVEGCGIRTLKKLSFQLLKGFIYG